MAFGVCTILRFVTVEGGFAWELEKHAIIKSAPYMDSLHHTLLRFGFIIQHHHITAFRFYNTASSHYDSKRGAWKVLGQWSPVGHRKKDGCRADEQHQARHSSKSVACDT
jgi:hypothetical protein